MLPDPMRLDSMMIASPSGAPRPVACVGGWVFVEANSSDWRFNGCNKAVQRHAQLLCFPTGMIQLAVLHVWALNKLMEVSKYGLNRVNFQDLLVPVR